MIRYKDGKVIRTRTRSRGNVFLLNPNEMTCLVAKVDGSWLLHKRLCHMNFDSIVRTIRMFVVRYFPKIVKPTNTIYKECVLAKHKKTYFSHKKFTTIKNLEIVHMEFRRSYKY